MEFQIASQHSTIKGRVTSNTAVAESIIFMCDKQCFVNREMEHYKNLNYLPSDLVRIIYLLTLSSTQTLVEPDFSVVATICKYFQLLRVQLLLVAFKSASCGSLTKLVVKMS